MEERIIDRDEGRGIRIKTTKDGETDAVDALAPEGEDTEEMAEEAVLTLPEDEEYDEDLVGLTPSQLREELARRERAKREAMEMSEALTSEGEKKLSEGDFAGAENCFAQAIVYGYADERAEKGLWRARTKDLSEIDPLLSEDASEELVGSEAAHALVLETLGDRLKKELASFRAEEGELSPRVEKDQATRRTAFAANRAYYRVRVGAALLCCLVFAIGCVVSAGFIWRTLSIAPVVLTAVFGALAFAALVVLVVFARGLVVASRLYRTNEALSSTEDGKRVAYLRERIACLERILGEEA